jgi:hypothetical protein
MARPDFKDGTSVRITKEKLKDLNRFARELRYPMQEILDAWLEVLIKNSKALLPQIEKRLKRDET